MFSGDIIDEERLEADVLWKFFRSKFIGKHHCYESDISKSFPPNVRSSILATAKRLVKKGLLEAYPKKREMVYRLNNKRLDEIKAIIKKHFPEVNINLF
jgi:hypothetical protein